MSGSINRYEPISPIVLLIRLIKHAPNKTALIQPMKIHHHPWQFPAESHKVHRSLHLKLRVSSVVTRSRGFYAPTLSCQRDGLDPGPFRAFCSKVVSIFSRRTAGRCEFLARIQWQVPHTG